MIKWNYIADLKESVFFTSLILSAIAVSPCVLKEQTFFKEVKTTFLYPSSAL